MAKIIVAVHGMGEQFQQETIQSVSERVCQIATKKRRIVSLGSFHLDKAAKVVLFESPPDPPTLSEHSVGFIEVFWCDIPREVVDKKFTLEKTKRWGKSLAFRIASLREAHGGACDLAAFDSLDEAIPEIVEAIGVVETTMLLLKKANLPFFDVAPVLTSYLGDVQVVTEYPYYRDQILRRFIDVFRAIADDPRTDLQDAEIYVVAHSEGTVVSFLSLLKGLSHPDAEIRNVFRRVRGFMTFGSPIDKHLILWPELWKEFEAAEVAPLEPRIRWRNYFDYADPVGAGLDEARHWLAVDTAWHKVFDFPPENDFGYQRYELPGVAHVKYWTDDVIFRDFIDAVVAPQPGRRVSRELTAKTWWAFLVGLTLPYAVAAAILSFGVYALLKGILEGSEKDVTGISLAMCVVVIAAALGGLTVLARVPVIVRTLGGRLKGIFWGVLLCLPIVLHPPAFEMLPDPDEARTQINVVAEEAVRITAAASDGRTASVIREADGSQSVVSEPTPATRETIVAKPVERIADEVPTVRQFLNAARNDELPPAAPWYWLAWAVAVLGTTAYLAGRIFPRLKLRVLMWSAAGTVIGGSLLWQALGSGIGKSLWPILLGGAVFLYMWWLAALFFDVILIWRRYIYTDYGLYLLRRELGKCISKPTPPVGMKARVYDYMTRNS
jgi:hypothetical protein